MINYLDLKPLRIYRAKFNCVLNPNDKYNNSAIFLLTPNYKSTLNLMENKFFVNRRYYRGYYFEPSVTYYITDHFLQSGDIQSYNEFYGLSDADIILYEAEKDEPTTITSPTNFRNPTKPRVKSRRTSDGYRISPSKKSLNMARDPKSLMRHLRYDMRRPKYKLNKLKDLDRSNIGGKINDKKSIEKNKKLMNKGKDEEEKRKEKEAANESMKVYWNNSNVDEPIIHESYIQTNDVVTFTDTNVVNESHEAVIRRLIHKDRLKSSSDINAVYRKVRKDTDTKIKIYNKEIKKYNGKNIFYDLSYYNDVFFKNNTYSGLRGLSIYTEFLSRQLNNKKIEEAGYEYNALFIPVSDWATSEEDLDFKKNLNPLSVMMRALRKKDTNFFKIFPIPIIFFGDLGYFKVDFRDEKFNYTRLMRLLRKLVATSVIEDDDEDVEQVEDETPEDITNGIVSDIEAAKKVTVTTPVVSKTTSVSTAKTPVNNKVKAPTNTTRPSVVKPVKVTSSDTRNKPDDKPKAKTTTTTTVKPTPKPVKTVPVTKTVVTNKGATKEVVNEPKDKVIKEKEAKLNDTINAAVAKSNAKDKETAIKWIDDSPEDSEKILKAMQELEDIQPEKVKVSNARSKRMETLNKAYPTLTINNQKVSKLLEESDELIPLKSTKVDQIDTINDGWEDLKFTNFEKSYDIDADLAKIFKSFSTNKEYPVAVRNVEVVNNSNSQDYLNTYILSLEDLNGKRSTMKFDMPILIDDKFMKIKGNKKTMQKQIAPIPVCKIDQDASQISTNYMKVTLSQFGADGKSFVDTDSIVRCLKNGDVGKVKIRYGDNRNFYDNHSARPIDFLDLSSYYSEINIDNEVIYDFELNRLKSLFPDKPLQSDKSYMVGYTQKGNKKTPLYYEYADDTTFSSKVLDQLNMDPEFNKVYNKLPNRSRVRCKYSRARILQINIPVIVLICFYEGLTSALNKSNITYVINDNRVVPDAKQSWATVRFKDAYLHYVNTYESSMLLNGLGVINTQDYNISDTDRRDMYLEYMNDNGYGNKVDGLLNFYDLMMDPITVGCCERFGLPTDFVSMLIYASNLLVDNKYIVNTDMSSRRIRSTELIAGYTYLAMAKAYQEYANQKRHGRDVPFTMKQSAVIDMIMIDPTFSDMPLLNDLQIFEAGNAVSYKGLSGMNNDRSYSLDKRTYDPSMLNIIGMATGFAGTVGVNRQLTIDPNVVSQRGLTKTVDDPKEANLDLTKTFTMTEAISPYGVTRNDPMRSAMNFIQTSSHGMRVEKGSPSLVTTGADQALPYLSDDTFSFKSKNSGKVKELTDDYMILEYKDKTTDLIDLRDNMLKNSNGGFYTSVKLKPTVKEGDSFKTGKILAFDPQMYSDDIAFGDTLSYKLGTLSKVAILNTSDGFEDSAIISETLSNQMASDIVEEKTVTLSKNTNILNIVKVGDPIQEGDPLIVFQDAGDEEYVSQLMTSLNVEKDKYGVGSIPVKSNVTGVVKAIKVFRTVPLTELRPSLRKIVKAYESKVNTLSKVAMENKIKDAYKYEAEMLPATGRLKRADDGVIIEFYLEYHDKMGIGDKLIYLDAVKGVVQTVIPAGDEPYTERRPDEKVHSLLAKGSLDARMVTSVRLVGALNKALIELDRSIKEELGIPWKNIDELGK